MIKRSTSKSGGGPRKRSTGGSKSASGAKRAGGSSRSSSSGERSKSPAKRKTASNSDFEERPARRSSIRGEDTDRSNRSAAPRRRSDGDSGERPARRYNSRSSDDSRGSDRGSRSDAPRRRSDGDSGERPARRYNSRSSDDSRGSDRGGYSDAPRRRSGGDSGERPARRYNSRSSDDSRGSDRGSRSDAPRRRSDGDSGERPARRYNSRGSDDNRSSDRGGYSDAPRRRSNSAGEDRPYRKRASDDGNDRPKRRTSSSERSNDSGERPTRRFSSREDGDKGFSRDERPARSSRSTREEGSSSGFVRKGANPEGSSENAYKGARRTTRRDDQWEDMEHAEKEWKSRSASGRKRIPAKTEADSAKSDKDGIRLNKYLSNAGVASRRDADVLISTGAVTVNGEVITTMGYRVMPGDKVIFGGQAIMAEKPVYILMNKPKDFITSTEDPDGRKVVMELIKGVHERVYPVGRLDRNTTGVLLLTNDGEMAQRLMHPKYEISKVYALELDKKLAQAHLEEIRKGVELEDGFIKPDEVDYVAGLDKYNIGIEIHSGRNRIVRRIFEHFGYEVIKLDRVSYGFLTKKDLSRGKWRHLEADEIRQLRQLTGLISSKRKT